MGSNLNNGLFEDDKYVNNFCILHKHFPTDGMLVHCRLTPSVKCAGTNLYTWVERGTVRVRLAQEQNTMSPARASTEAIQKVVKCTNHESIMSPIYC